MVRTRKPSDLVDKNLKVLAATLPQRVQMSELSPVVEKERLLAEHISVSKREPVVSPAEEKRPLAAEEKAVYVSYYEILREKIRRELDRTFQRPLSAGEVGITFILSAQGKLVKAWVTYSSGIRRLDEVALRSVKRAAPYYPLPKGIEEKDASFNVIISFEIK